MRTIRVIIILAVIISCGLSNADSSSTKGSVCFPPSWDGIVAGYTLDKDIVKIYGKGKFVDHVGHGGGRAYLDSTKSVEMITAIGVNGVIEYIEIISTKDRESSLKNIPVSKRINKNAGFGVWGKLGIGSEVKEVTENLGQPQERETNEKGDLIWHYNTDYSNTDCYAYAEIVITFRSDKIYSVLFYNGC